MAFVLIDSFTFTPGSGGGTSAGRNTTGANSFFGVTGTASAVTGVSDSINGAWTGLTVRGTAGKARIWYFENGTGGAAQTFTTTGAASFPAVIFFSFSGGATASMFDVENGTSSGVGTTTGQPGSVTPSGGATNSLIIISFGDNVITDTVAMPTGYTGFNLPSVGGTNYQGAGAFKIKTDAVAENPTWNWTTPTDIGLGIAVFKAAAGATGGGPLMDNGELINGGPLIKGRLINYPVYHPENILRMRQGRRLKKVA